MICILCRRFWAFRNGERWGKVYAEIVSPGFSLHIAFGRLYRWNSKYTKERRIIVPIILQNTQNKEILVSNFRLRVACRLVATPNCASRADNEPAMGSAGVSSGLRLDVNYSLFFSEHPPSWIGVNVFISEAIRREGKKMWAASLLEAWGQSSDLVTSL